MYDLPYNPHCQDSLHHTQSDNLDCSPPLLLSPSSVLVRRAAGLSDKEDSLVGTIVWPGARPTVPGVVMSSVNNRLYLGPYTP